MKYTLRILILISTCLWAIACGGATPGSDEPIVNTSTSVTGSTLAGNPIELEFTGAKAVVTVPASAGAISNIRIVTAQDALVDPFQLVSNSTAKAGYTNAPLAGTAGSGNALVHITRYATGPGGRIALVTSTDTGVSINGATCPILVIDTTPSTAVSCVNTTPTDLSDSPVHAVLAFEFDDLGNLFILEGYSTNNELEGAIATTASRWNADSKTTTALFRGDTALGHRLAMKMSPDHTGGVYLALRTTESLSVENSKLATHIIQIHANNTASTLHTQLDLDDPTLVVYMQALETSGVVIRNDDRIQYFASTGEANDLGEGSTTYAFRRNSHYGMLALELSPGYEDGTIRLVQVTTQSIVPVPTPGTNHPIAEYASNDETLLYSDYASSGEGMALFSRPLESDEVSQTLIERGAIQSLDFSVAGNIAYITGFDSDDEAIFGYIDLSNDEGLQLLPTTESSFNNMMLVQ